MSLNELRHAGMINIKRNQDPPGTIRLIVETNWDRDDINKYAFHISSKSTIQLTIGTQKISMIKTYLISSLFNLLN